jgi:hypothetical protein
MPCLGGNRDHLQPHPGLTFLPQAQGALGRRLVMPEWVAGSYSVSQVRWVAGAVSAFYRTAPTVCVMIRTRNL